MKSVILALSVLSMTSTFADTAMKSSALAGEYHLTKATGYCPESVSVTVEEEAVRLFAHGGFLNSHFYSADSGCERTTGDIGPVRSTCVTFKGSSVSRSVSEPISIAGYIKEKMTLKVSGKQNEKLTYSNDITMIPFGILGIADQDKFKCEYERI